MNIQHAPSGLIESREQHSYARVPQHWLLPALLGWVVLVVLTLAILFASLPVYIALLQTPCTGPACEWQQLTPGRVATLKGIGLSLSDYVACTVALRLVLVLICLVVSTLIVWRRPDDRMALFVALMLVPSGSILASSLVPAFPSPWQVPYDCLIFLFLALFMLVFSLFPSGQFVPSFMRWVLVILLVGQIPLSFFPFAPLIPNTPSQPGWLAFLGEGTTLALFQLYRYQRVSNSLERQQTKWVVFGFAMAITLFVSLNVPYLLFPVLASPGSLYPLAYNLGGVLVELLIPLSFGLAILRSRLWEIDLLINRTLVYGALTIILTGVYVGLVIGLQALLHGIINQNNGLVIVISTLAIAALFQPLRQHLQRLIDRRFYRRKHDTAKTLETFSTTLRNEIDLNQLSEQLVAVVEETMQPTHVSLWLRPTEPSRQQNL